MHASTTFYVSAARPDDSGDGLSWDTAKKTIQAAVDLAADGDIVLVTNGLYATGGTVTPDYACSNRVVITKNILVISVNGPRDTIIQGHGSLDHRAVRCAYLSAGVLAGFTLTNGSTCSSGSYDYDLSGGAVNMYGGKAVVSNCIIIDNRAFYFGGGTAYGAVYNCSISGNRADSEGGGTYFGIVYNSAISANRAAWGGGTANSAIMNCIISRNTAMNGGDGTYGGSACNTIIFHNGRQNWCNGAFTNCCAVPLPPGPGNICNDPLLLDIAHIHESSPCVGTGDSFFVRGVDVDGETWRTAPAIGCDEVYPGGLTGTLSVTIVPPGTAAVAGTELQYIALVNGRAADLHWSFGDGTIFQHSMIAVHAWDTPGTYDVIARVYNADNPGGIAATVRISIVNAEAGTFYVNAVNSAPSYPYRSWSTAAVTIQDAVDAAQAIIGARVIVTNGVYTSGQRATPGYVCLNRLVITTDVTVASVNGPAATIIRGQGPLGNQAVRCVYMSAGRLIGFTLTNGFTRSTGDLYYDVSGGGINMRGGNAVVSNCIISGNRAINGGGTFAGTCIHCIIRGNSAEIGGAACLNTLYNSSLMGNYALDWAGGAFASTLSNCTVWGNFASSLGGGMFSGVIYDSFISSNTAHLGAGGYSCTLVNSVICSNSAYGNGSGGGTAYGAVIGCTVCCNNAGWGGGCYYGVVKNSAISGNSSTYSGGGTVKGMLYDSTISGNCAGWNGGGLSGSMASNCTIYGNSAQSGGGAYCVPSEPSILDDCVIISNTAVENGGGTHGVTLNRCLVSGNSATLDGGGVFNGILSNCIIVCNTARSGGGGYGDRDAGTFNNCLVISNFANENGGGTFGCTLNNCTICANVASAGGGTYESSLMNSIVWANTATNHANYNGGSFMYSCSMALPPGIGNIDADPQFIDPSLGDYHLSELSPCINTGTNLPGIDAQSDLDGNSRIYVADGVGIVDMGCYEAIPEPLCHILIGLVCMFSVRRQNA